jgi:flavin reductase (DIM6/NTAB) family NADH-FMN oxidoreductase RutF
MNFPTQSFFNRIQVFLCAMMTIDPLKEKTSTVHSFLLSAVAPRPIAFASTVDKNGNPNLSPFSFFNCFGAKPPVLVFSPSRRVRDNTLKHTLENIYEVKEVVINTVNYDMVHQMSLSSVEYPKGVNEFIKAGFTPVHSERVKPFRVKESPVQFECKVNEVVELGKEGGAGNLVICEILLMHIREDILTDGKIDPNKIDLVARMGGDLYCRASGKAVFDVEKPSTQISIGIDNIPESIRTSDVLTGNNLGQLGSVLALPSNQEVQEYKKSSAIQTILSQHSGKQLEQQLHLFAKQLLEEKKITEAWKVLMVMK